MKRTAIILGILLCLVLVAVLAIPFLVDANRYRSTLEAKLSETLGRQVSIGDLKLAILSGSVAAGDISISEDPAFGSTPFLRAQSLKVGVELMPLILSRTLNVTGIAIDKPDIDLIQDASGAWNFSSLGARPPVRPPASVAQAPQSSSNVDSPAATPDFSVAKLKIENGRVTLRRLGGKAKPIVLDKTAIEVTNFSQSSAFPFSLTASLPAGGSIELQGRAGPFVAGDAIATPLDAKLTIKHLDLIESGAVDPATGLAGLASIDGDVKSDHATFAAQGKLKVDQARLAAGGSPAKRPLELDFAVQQNLKTLLGVVQRADIHVGGALARLTGTYNLHTEPPAVDLKLSGSKVPLTELASVLPALNIAIPSGAEIEAGTADVNLVSQGPLDKLQTTGTVGVENAKLAKYDLASKLKVLEQLAGIKAEPQTSIQTLSANVKNSPEGTALDNIQFLVPSIGQMTGSGTIDPAHALNFKMRVAVHSTVSALTALGSKNGIPFTISGTSQDPSFQPDVKGLATDELKGLAGGKNAGAAATAAEGLIKGLFGGRKK
jgi:AsmA protein